MCDGLIVTKASPALKEKMQWLEGLYRVRNCLAHRRGKVQMIDVKPPGASLDQTKEEDRLKAIWLRVRVSVDGEEVHLPYSTTKETKGSVDFIPFVREWKVGDQIDVDPVDCQSIAITFQFLGQQLQADFEREMTELLGLSAPQKR